MAKRRSIEEKNIASDLPILLETFLALVNSKQIGVYEFGVLEGIRYGRKIGYGNVAYLNSALLERGESAGYLLLSQWKPKQVKYLFRREDIPSELKKKFKECGYDFSATGEEEVQGDYSKIVELWLKIQ